jgi:hypothetical protein
MRDLVQELPNNEIPEITPKVKQDLPDVITLDDITAYDYKFENMRGNELAEYLESWK